MVTCAVAECDVTSGSNPKKYKFHRFPSNSLLRDKWIRILDRGNWTPHKYSCVCSKHFESSCFIQRQHRTFLMKDSIPTLHVPVTLKTRRPCSYVYRDILPPLAEPLTDSSNQKIITHKLCEDEIKLEAEEETDEDFENDSESSESTLHEDLIKQEITIDEDFETSIPSVLVPVPVKEEDPLENSQDSIINLTIEHDHDYEVAVPTETGPPVPAMSTHQGSKNPTMLIGPLPTSHIPSDLYPRSDEVTLNVEASDVAVVLEQEIARNAAQTQTIETMKRKVKALNMLLKKRDEQVKTLKSEIRMLKLKI